MKNLQINSRITPRASRTIDTYLKDIAQLPLLTPDEEVSLARRIHDGDPRALERMVQGNLRFVVSVAKNYQNMGLELVDLISAGNMGLVTAAKRFDETRGFKFCSYAVWWIRQSIMQAISKEGRTVALPANQLTLLSKMGREASRLEQELQRSPTAAEVTERLNANEEHVNWLLNNSERPLSLDAPIQGDDSSMRIDTIADRSTRTDDSLMAESLRTEIESALAMLPQSEQSILKLSFGIDHPHPCSLDEIAMQMKLTRERVRQIQAKAITRLRRSSNRERLKCICNMEDNVKNWLEEADKAAYKALDYANKINPTFAETIKGIKNPLSEQDIDGYYKEDPYKGVIATALYLDKHILTPREFVILASSRADVIRCQIRYWTDLLEKEGIRSAFYASAGFLCEKRKPKDIESSAIFTLPPWELLHFLGFNLPMADRPPVYNIHNHYRHLKRINSNKCKEWLSWNDDGKLIADNKLMDYIYFDYCTRCRSGRKKYPELEIIPWRGVMYSNKGTSPEYPITLYCKKELAGDVETAILNTLLDCRLYLEQYENVDIVGIEERTINGESYDVATLHIQYYNIFGKMTSQHLSEWFFRNNYRE